jgi:hypothetical protein
MQLPRGETEDLTTTQVIARPLRVWRVIIVTSVLAVLAALVTYHVMDGDPAPADDQAPPLVRMRATPAPIVSPIQEPGATPDPAATAGSNADRGSAVAPAPAPHGDR